MIPPTLHAPPHITLLLGGVRSGKSAKAVTLASEQHDPHTAPGPVLFVATGQPSDAEMMSRIEHHRRERPSHWTTVESPLHLAADIAQELYTANTPYAKIVIDCMTLWVSNILLSMSEHDNIEERVTEHVTQLLNVIVPRYPKTQHHQPQHQPQHQHQQHQQHQPHPHWILVSNEVGLGIVPPTLLGRQYRDALGRANQLLAAAADNVILLVAGLEVPLKRRSA